MNLRRELTQKHFRSCKILVGKISQEIGLRNPVTLRQSLSLNDESQTEENRSRAMSFQADPLYKRICGTLAGLRGYVGRNRRESLLLHHLVAWRFAGDSLVGAGSRSFVRVIGFVVDLFALGQKPVLTVIIWTIFTGAMAVTYLLIPIRAPRFLLLAVVVHLLGSRLIAYGIHRVAGRLEPLTVESGVRTAADAVLVLSMASCLFFLLFIQHEGRHSVRIQTELSLAHSIQQTLVPKITIEYSLFEIYGASVPRTT
jgi:hypothetical protein